MFIVLYSFEPKPEKEITFLNAWGALTNLIYEYEGSLGSRLHKKESGKYIAYAQWPSKEQFEQSGSNLPEEANLQRDLMRDSCEKIEVLDKFEVVEDLLKHKPHA